MSDLEPIVATATDYLAPTNQESLFTENQMKS